MFEHSIRVPRHFKIAANIYKKVYKEGGSVKTLLYDNKLKHFRTNALYALISETIKNAAHIENMFESTGILVNEPRLDHWLAKVLTAELLYGKKTLPGKSKPEQTILSYREKFETYSTELQDDQKSKVVPRPRYVRINTNLLTTSDAIRAFQDEGYKFIRCTSGSYNDYLKQIQNLTEYDFTQDYHVKTIFVFSPGTKFHEHDLYLENKIILQDKATALAVHLLAPPAGSVVLDMCAAPGMKTTQLAAYLRNQGKIYAVERNEKRYETLCQYVEATESKCVETLHKDSLEIRRGDLDDVEYILLDPSCSGSGMDLSVHNYIDETRLAKLTSLQEKFLKHAMNAFPNAKRIVYSTCSVFPEENERVVTNIVKASRAKWRVKDVKELLKDQWNNFGSGMYGSMGTRCLYAKPDSDFTTGFFLAVLDRDFRDNHNGSKNHNTAANQIRKDENYNLSNLKHNTINTKIMSEEINYENTVQKNKQKKRKKGDIENESSYENSGENINDHEEKYAVSNSEKKKIKVKDDLRRGEYKEENADITVESIDIISETEHKLQESSSVRTIKASDNKTNKKNKRKDLEISENKDHINENLILIDESEIPKKKKKKHKTHVEKFAVPISIDITSSNKLADKYNTSKCLEKLNEMSVVDNDSDTKKCNYIFEENIDNSKRTEKKKKKYKRDKEDTEANTFTNVSTNSENHNNCRKSDKEENLNKLPCELAQQKSLVTYETDNKKEKSKISDVIETLESNLKDDDNISKVHKSKKKKRKASNKDLEEPNSDTLLETDIFECIGKDNKKSKKIMKLINPDETQETSALTVKNIADYKKKGTKHLQDTEIPETFELSEQLAKKKKKKRDVS